MTLCMSQRHENVIAWQRADDLCVAIYKLTETKFPRSERFGLTSQLRRASYSVAANIVEGFAFESDAAKLRFLRIAAASLAEVGYGVHLSVRLGYLSASGGDGIAAQIGRAAAPLHGLIRQLKRERTTRVNR
jgi:four helix bundle protein